MHTRRGRIRPTTVSLISLLAVVSIAMSGMPAAAGVALALAVVLAAGRSLVRPETHTIRLDRSASPALDGMRGRLDGEAVTGLFVALRLVAPDGQTRRVLVYRDELGLDEFRALLAYLRHG
ncbi:MAG: hypothetical protein CMP07_03445 [Xanthomonadales bacterium]|nr:hypothetical protein [Xanthomonadales bacterium]